MRLAIGVSLAVLVGVIYCRSITFGFAGLDDNRYVARNQPVLDGLSANGVRWAFTTFYAGMYVPLTWLSLMADSSAYGSFPGGYRMTNIFLHAANAFLVFYFFDRVTRSRWRSVFVAAMFAVHPLHVESVVWITERKDVLSICFGLLALNVYASYALGGRRLWLALGWGLFVCSLLAKQTLVTLPFLLLTLDYWPFERLTKRPWPVVLEKIPFFLTSALFSAVIYYAQSLNGATALLARLSLSERVANGIASYGRYLLHVIWPVHLAFFYPHPRYGWGSPAVLISLAVLLAVSGASIVFIKRRPQIFVGWCWFLGTLVPMLGLVQVGRQGMADRFAYFPLIGIYVLVAWLLPRRVLYGVAPALVAASAAIAFVQVGYWKDDDALFGRAIAVDDNESIRAYYGGRLLEQGRVDDGVRQCFRAVELDPKSDFAHERLGVGLAAQGRNEEAVEQFKAAIAIRDDQPSYYTRLAAVLARQGKDKEAAEYFARAVRLMPELEQLAQQPANDDFHPPSSSNP